MSANDEVSKRAREVFSRNLKIHMARMGISQTDIAERLNVSSSTTSDWVNANKYPRVNKMQELADYLGVRISDLREEAPSTKNDDTGRTSEFIWLFNQLSENEQEIITKQITAKEDSKDTHCTHDFKCRTGTFQ